MYLCGFWVVGWGWMANLNLELMVDWMILDDIG